MARALQLNGGGGKYTLMPSRDNYFAEGANYPSLSLTFKPSLVPRSQPSSSATASITSTTPIAPSTVLPHPASQKLGEDRAVRYEAPQVTGRYRYRYMLLQPNEQKPNSAKGEAPLQNFTLDPSHATSLKERAKLAQPTTSSHLSAAEYQQLYGESKTRTVAVQTMYRESEAQTDPYSPPIHPDQLAKLSTLPPHLQPDIMALTNLTYGHGLPAGPPELEMVERAMQRRQWEATLPQIALGDEVGWKKRLAQMENREMEEWELREKEIRK